MSNTMDQKCPNCRAPLKYSAKNKDWTCDYCGAHVTLEDIKKARNDKEKIQTKKKVSDGYTCKNCGAQIIVSENTSATSCVYCRSTALISDRLEEEFTPHKIIPFKKTKEEAISAFIKCGKKRIFTPKIFTNKKNIQEIQGIYIPFWLFDFDLTGKIDGTGTRVSSWTSGDYRYTKTDTYHFEREGTFPFLDIPVDGSKHFDDALMNSIEPFDYKDLVDFDGAYLSGFLSEKYDLTKDEVENIVIERAINTAVDELKKTTAYVTTNVKNKNFTPVDLDSEYVLLPVWLLNIKYNGKVYPYAMNGQTGKMIGDLPISKKRVALFFIGTFLMLTIIIILLFMIGGFKL